MLSTNKAIVAVAATIVAAMSLSQGFEANGSNADACPNSIVTPTVVLGACDSGVQNDLLADGCTIADLLQPCGTDSATHGKYGSCVAHVTLRLRRDGVISGAEKGRIESCAARPVPEGCLILGVLERPGQVNPENPCQRCSPEFSRIDWSSVADGTTCDDGIEGASTDTCVGGSCGPCAPQGRCSDDFVRPCAYDIDCAAIFEPFGHCEYNDSAPRFVDNGNETVTDRKTCLVWEQKSGVDAGSAPGEGAGDLSNPHDVDNEYTWSSNDVCDYSSDCPQGTAFTNFLGHLNAGEGFAGHADWRLPSASGVHVDWTDTFLTSGQLAELESVLPWDPALGPSAREYWSSSATSCVGGPETCQSLFAIIASDGVIAGTPRLADGLHARAVRGGPRPRGLSFATLSSDRSGIDSNADGSFDQLTPDDEGWLWIANQATLDERRTALEFDVADVDAASLVSVVLRVSIHGYGLPEPPPSPAPSLAFYVYSGDGVVDLADMTRTNVPLTTISLYPIPYPSYSYLIDATEAVRSLREQGVSHVGFLVTPTPGNYYVLLLSGEGIPRLPIDRPMLAIEQWESVRPEQPSSTRPSIAPPQR